MSFVRSSIQLVQGIVATEASRETQSPRARRLRRIAAGLVLLVVGVILAGIGLQSHAAFRWGFLPLLDRALGPTQLRIDAGRFQLPARIEITGLEILGADGLFEVRAKRLDLALDPWASQRAGRWVVDELTADGLHVVLSDAEPKVPKAPGFDPFAFELRRVDLREARLERTTASGARTTFGPGTFTLRDAVRGAEPRAHLSAPVQIVGGDRATYEGHVELDLKGALAATEPHLAWEGTANARLDPVRGDAAQGSPLELEAQLRGQLGGSMPSLLSADVRGRQAGREAGRLEASFARSASEPDVASGDDSAQTTATFAFSDVSTSLLNPALASLGLGPLETGLWTAELKWDSSPQSDKLSSRIDVRDLRVRHATGLLGPFLLHSAQSASWDPAARELSVDQFELDLVLAGVSRIRGRLDRPLLLFAPSGGLPAVGTAQGKRERARAQIGIVVESLPLNEVAALGVPIPRPFWAGKLTGKVLLGALDVAGAGEYAVDLTLSMPPSRKASNAALSAGGQARLELKGRSADKALQIERVQLGLRSGRDPLLKLTGSGAYGFATRRMDLSGSIEAGKLASTRLWGPLPLEWARELKVDAVRSSWQLALDAEGVTLRAAPRLVGLAGVAASRPRGWRLDDVQLDFALEAPRLEPLRIQELRVRVPDLGSEAELSLKGTADPGATPPKLDLDLAWKAVSLAALRETRLLSGVPWADRLSSGVLAGELSLDLEKVGRIEGTARLQKARVRLGEREVGPLSSTLDLTLSMAEGRASAFSADVACDSDLGPLLRFGARWPVQPSGPPEYSVNIGLLDLGRALSLFESGPALPGPVLSGELHTVPRGDGAVPFSFQLAGASPAADRLRGEGTFSEAQPERPGKIEARVNVERVTLDPYLELFDRMKPAPGPPAAQLEGADLEIQIDGQVGELGWRTLRFQQGSFAWTRDRRSAVLTLRPQRALGGDLRGQALLTTSDAARPRLEWELEGDTLDAEALMRALNSSDEGPLRGTLQIRTRGELQLGAGPHQGTGSAELLIANGQFGSSRLIEFMATQTRISALRRMRFETLTGELRLVGDSVEVVAVDVRSPIAGLAMTGTLDLSGKLGLRVLSRVGPQLKQLMSVTEYTGIVGGTLDSFLTLPILVLVNGTTSAPTFSVRPTTSSVTTGVWEAVSGTGKLLRRGTDSIFQGKEPGKPR